MKNAFGKMIITFSIPVENENETLAIMEAYHKIDPELMVGYQFVAINPKGEHIKVDVHNCEIDNDSLEVIEM